MNVDSDIEKLKNQLNDIRKEKTDLLNECFQLKSKINGSTSFELKISELENISKQKGKMSEKS